MQFSGVSEWSLNSFHSQINDILRLMCVDQRELSRDGMLPFLVNYVILYN